MIEITFHYQMYFCNDIGNKNQGNDYSHNNIWSHDLIFMQSRKQVHLSRNSCLWDVMYDPIHRNDINNRDEIIIIYSWFEWKYIDVDCKHIHI